MHLHRYIECNQVYTKRSLLLNGGRGRVSVLPRPAPVIGCPCVVAPPDRLFSGTSVPVVFPRHLRDGEVSDSGDERVASELADRLGRYRLEAGDIVCVRAGAMGPPALVRREQAGWLMSSNVIRLRCREDAQVLPGYLLAVLSRPEAIDWVRDRAAATAAPFITKAVLAFLHIDRCVCCRAEVRDRHGNR